MKTYNKTIFKVADGLEVLCETNKTRNGFRHTATLMVGGDETGMTASQHYLNRTWERYDYETVLSTLADKMEKLNRPVSSGLASDIALLREAIKNN